MEVLWTFFVQYLIEIIGAAVLVGIGISGTWALTKLAQNEKLQNITEAVGQLLEATNITVTALQQQFVEDWKKNQNGKLTEQQIAELKQKVVAITLEHLSHPTLELLNAAKIDIINIINTAAEAYVLKLKEDSTVI
jgi:ABC-type protease/lipase transport system fused ATPase/permease subunit